MTELEKPYVHIQNALTGDDLGYLKEACKRTLARTSTPCYSLIDDLESPTCTKIKAAVEAHVGATSYYLSDFYMFTEASAKAGWHVDTELFTFESAVNAWILLSPEEVDDPLGFLGGINESPACYYHGVKFRGDQATFRNMCSGAQEVRSLEEIESQRIHTPTIRVGDILLLNPRRFHKTNVDTPKHCCSIKYVFEGDNGFLAADRGKTSTYGQVPAFMWPEVAMFSKIVKAAPHWDGVLEGLRRSLGTPEGLKELSSGFFPERFELYKEKVQLL